MKELADKELAALAREHLEAYRAAVTELRRRGWKVEEDLESETTVDGSEVVSTWLTITRTTEEKL